MRVRPVAVAVAADVVVAIVVCSTLLASAAGAQAKAVMRTRSSVLLSAPDSTAMVRAAVKPRVSATATAASGAIQTAANSPLITAVRLPVRVAPGPRTVRESVATRPPGGTAVPPATEPARPTPVPTATDTTPAKPPATAKAAAQQLATQLYGPRAKLATVNVINERTASVWVGDAAVKQPAPPGLDVSEGVALPFRYISVDPKSGEVMALKPWFDDGGGLRYDSRSGAYVATLRIGLRDTLHATQGRALSPKIRLSVAAAADSVTPEILEIGETNVFITKARLLTRRIASAMRVTVWPDFSDRGVDLWIPFQPDSVIVRVDHESIDGFGLGEANVTVELSPGAAAPGDSIAVALESTNGTFATGPIVYPKGAGPVVTKLRSSGMGAQVITARAGVLIAGTQRIDFGFPTGLFFGGALGALLGAGMLAMRERNRPESKGIGWLIASGLIAGLLIALIAAVGVAKIPGFDLPAGGSALVSLLAGALGGYVGPKGMESLFGAFSAGKKPAPAS